MQPGVLEEPVRTALEGVDVLGPAGQTSVQKLQPSPLVNLLDSQPPEDRNNSGMAVMQPRVLETQFPRGNNSFVVLNNLIEELAEDANLEACIEAAHAEADKEIDMVMGRLSNPSHTPKVDKPPVTVKALAVGKKSFVVTKKSASVMGKLTLWNQLEWVKERGSGCLTKTRINMDSILEY